MYTRSYPSNDPLPRWPVVFKDVGQRLPPRSPRARNPGKKTRLRAGGRNHCSRPITQSPKSLLVQLGPRARSRTIATSRTDLRLLPSVRANNRVRR